MKILQGIVAAIAVVMVCYAARAETPVTAVGVSIVGTTSCQPPNAGLRCSNLSTDPYVLLGGWFYKGDGGGGYFAQGLAGCTDNGGTILKDSNNDCFYRMDDRAAIPVKWFGAKCDATKSVFGGSILASSTTFTSSAPGVTFQPGDVGKTIELNYQSATPFVTTISGYISSTQVTLNHAAPSTYPGQVGATSANFSPIQQDGLDSPGAGYKPQDVLTVACTTCGSSIPAQITVRATGVVGFGSTTGGTGYAVGDSIYLTALPASSYATANAAEIQVQSVDPSTGAVTGYTFVSSGDFRPTSSSTATNPATFAISTSGGGSGFSVSLAPGNASFGVAEVYKAPTVAGQYSTFPPIPSATSDSGTGTGATIGLTFPTPTWIYATDDTGPLQRLETWMETDYDRGIYNAAEVPGGHTCLLQTLTIQRPVTWRSSGSRQAELMQIMGSQGSTVDSTNHAFVLVAVNHSSSDPYQDLTVSQATVGLNNISIIGGTNMSTVNVNGTPTTYTNDGLLFTNGTASGIAAALENLQVINFPGNALAANKFAGELRGYDIVARGAGENCVDLRATDNPYRFYGLRASGCKYGAGIYLHGTQAEEFHGVSVFGNLIDLSLTGTRPSPKAYVLIDGAQFQGSSQENIYLDQQNETLICAANCEFEDAWQMPCPTSQSCGAIEIGPDARTSATGNAPVIAQFNQGMFSSSPEYDVLFDTNANGRTCKCSVALGAGMVDVATQSGTGIPTTNGPAQLTGQTTYAPPVFANAASVGVPLTLAPAELGIGVSPGTGGAPNAPGLKLRVECGTTRGTAKIVALAGGSSSETVIADNIGGSVGGGCGN